jgi:hypothetical protein
VSASITAQAFQVNGVAHSANTEGLDRVAGLVGGLKHAELSPTELKHLWHERKTVEATVSVKCVPYLVRISYFHPIARMQVQMERLINY